MMRLVIAPLNYSSWSVRAWLALEHSGADFKTHEIALLVDPDWREKVLRFSGAGKVPLQGQVAGCEARIWEWSARALLDGRIQILESKMNATEFGGPR